MSQIRHRAGRTATAAVTLLTAAYVVEHGKLSPV
ncbi:hypothetical protein SZN_16962 [Streptomyces zinciresistens K42]|uniref:Uncharacterized protein n=1 Tax=Streptomyces zinciresistens K42 TaxID=700597 RepID=G2GD15_9ACTN|nr:hypothetical protein SZN_16962 [Streptomyces zinciresistens K42]